VDKHSFYEQLKLGYIEQEKKEETNQKTIESQ
jgi:hypothetical protein